MFGTKKNWQLLLGRHFLNQKNLIFVYFTLEAFSKRLSLGTKPLVTHLNSNFITYYSYDYDNLKYFLHIYNFFKTFLITILDGLDNKMVYNVSKQVVKHCHYRIMSNNRSMHFFSSYNTRHNKFYYFTSTPHSIISSAMFKAHLCSILYFYDICINMNEFIV